MHILFSRATTKKKRGIVIKPKKRKWNTKIFYTSKLACKGVTEKQKQKEQMEKIPTQI